MHVKGLHSKGHEIHLYSTSASDQDYLPLRPFGASETILPLPSRDGKKGAAEKLTAHLRSPEAEYRIQTIETMKSHAAECSALINKRGCDILFANSCQFTYNSAIGCYADLPSVSYLQEPYRPLYEASPRLPWLLPNIPTAHPRNPIKRLAEKYRNLHVNYSHRLQATEELIWASSFTQILCNSQFSRESILRAYNLESKVCYLGIDSDSIKPPKSEKRPYVIGVGSIHYTKRIPAAIRAISLIPKSTRPDLLWIGNFADEDYKASLLQLADQLNVNLGLRVLVSDQELYAAMGEAACFLYTSHLEPFGLTPLEANACGTAVVAIGEGGVRETIIQGINGFTTTDNCPEELAEHIVRFTENLDYANSFGIQARNHVVKQWSVHDAIDRLEHHLFTIAR